MFKKLYKSARFFKIKFGLRQPIAEIEAAGFGGLNEPFGISESRNDKLLSFAIYCALLKPPMTVVNIKLCTVLIFKITISLIIRC